MPYVKRVIILCIILILITGCGAKNSTLTPNVDQTSASGVPSNPTGGTAYPGPLGGSGDTVINTITTNQVDQLIIPTPSTGKAVVTGQLKADTAAGGLNLKDLFLSPIASSDTTEDLSSVTYSSESDPIATIEIGTGRFVFTDIAPGKYALMIWTSVMAYPTGDSAGNTIIFTVNPDELKDLGAISIQ